MTYQETIEIVETEKQYTIRIGKKSNWLCIKELIRYNTDVVLYREGIFLGNALMPELMQNTPYKSKTIAKKEYNKLKNEHFLFCKCPEPQIQTIDLTGFEHKLITIDSLVLCKSCVNPLK